MEYRVMGKLISYIFFGLWAIGVTSAIAEDETFRIRSMAEKEVQIKFFSQDRHHVWPGIDQVWDLLDTKEHVFKLGCEEHENICYGAWVKGTNRYWGLGIDGKQKTCSGCCHDCTGGSVREIILRDPVHY
jgi:hypothetical protein